MSRGKFIVIEGIDGAGKTTQAKALEAWLKTKDIPVWLTAEPTYGPIGKDIRQKLQDVNNDPVEIAKLFRLDRKAHLFEEDGICARLDKGEWVICDRYIYSMLVYQGDMSEEFLTREVLLSNSVIQPDILIYISLDAKTANQRIAERKQEINSFENLPKLQRLASNYWQLLKDNTNHLHFLSNVRRIIQVEGKTPSECQTEMITNILSIEYPELKI